MKKLALGVYVAVALFGLLGALVLHNAPLDARQLTDGYGVSEGATAGNFSAASVQIAK
jgi:hypothetical protein